VQSSSKKKPALTLTLAIVLVLGIILAIIVTRSSGQKTLEVSGVSLSPSEISANSCATLSFSIRNSDLWKPHQMGVEFIVPDQVNLQSANEPLLQTAGVGTGGGLLAYPIWIHANTKTSMSLNVTYNKLFPLKSTSTFKIQLNFYDENHTKIESETLSLKVNQ
jgi:hypothetical protein